MRDPLLFGTLSSSTRLSSSRQLVFQLSLSIPLRQAPPPPRLLRRVRSNSRSGGPHVSPYQPLDRAGLRFSPRAVRVQINRRRKRLVRSARRSNSPGRDLISLEDRLRIKGRAVRTQALLAVEAVAMGSRRLRGKLNREQELLPPGGAAIPLWSLEWLLTLGTISAPSRSMIVTKMARGRFRRFEALWVRAASL